MKKPPYLATRFLRWYCNLQLVEEIEGDLHTLFLRRVQRYGFRRAQLMYWLNVLMFFHPSVIKREQKSSSHNETAMLQNYFKIAVRNFVRHKTYVLINLLGMGLALSCCIVAFLNLDYKLRFDDFHREKTASVYRVNTVRETENGKEPWGLSPLALGSAIAHDITGIERVMRLQKSQGIAKANNKTFAETLQYADMELLNVFNFPLLYGDSTAFQNPGMVVLDEGTSAKYFGEVNPVGESMIIINQFGREKSFVVGAVTRKVPENTSILFGIMVPINHLFEPKQLPESDWRADIQTTIFVELSPGYQPEDIDKVLEGYVAIQNSFRDDFKVADFYLQPFKELAFTSDIDLPGWVQGRELNRNAVGFLVGITSLLSLMILLTACFNFTNTSIAFSSNRLKEIGIRKVIGGARSQLIRQFMVEHLLLCFLSIGVGLVGAHYLLDAYNGLFGQTLDMQYVFKSRVILFLIGLPVITAILAGTYPAFKISKYQPAAILKGKTRFASMGGLSKVLLTAQFSFSCFALIGSIILIQNAAYQEQVDFGYDLHKIAVVSIKNQQEFSVFQNAIVQNPDIENTAGAAKIVGQSYEVPVKIHPDDKPFSVRRLEIGNNYLQTVGIDLIAGRDFMEGSASDQQQAVIINQKMAESLGGGKDVLNQQIYMEDKPYQIIGIAENHKEFGLLGEEPPCLFSLANPTQFRYLSISTKSGQLSAIGDYLMQTWFKVNSNVPFNGFFQEMLIYKQWHINIILRNLCFFLAVATLIMSAAGFFSIVSLSVLKRTKEIGIRKVFGGSISQMMQLIVKDFVKFILIAFMIGSVLGYVAIQEVLFTKMYTYHAPFGMGVFLFALLVMLLIPGLTIGLKVYKTATANPSETLKYE